MFARPRLASIALVLAAFTPVACESTVLPASDPAAGVAAQGAPATATGPVRGPVPRLRFRAGEERRFVSRTRGNALPLDERAAKAAFSWTEEVGLHYRVSEVREDGAATSIVRFEWAAFSFDVPGLQWSYAVDTRDPASMERWNREGRGHRMLHGLAPMVDRVDGRTLRVDQGADGGVPVLAPAEGWGANREFGLLYGMQIAGWVYGLPAADAVVGSEEEFAHDESSESHGLHIDGRRRWDRTADGSGFDLSLEGRLSIRGRSAEGTGSSVMGMRFETLDLRATGRLDVGAGAWNSVRWVVAGKVAPDAPGVPEWLRFELELDTTFERAPE